MVESSRVKYRAMVESCRVKYRAMVESRRVKSSHVRVMQCEVE